DALDNLQIKHREEGGARDRHEQRCDTAEYVDRLYQVAGENLYEDEVEDDLEDTGETVVRAAELTGMVAHRHLDHLGSHPRGVDRYEAMHLAVETHPLQDLLA